MSNYTNSTFPDDDLIRLMKAGDRSAFESIYNKYWAKLYIAAYNLLRTREAAEDIVQEVLVQLWLKKDSLEITSLNAFLYAAVRYKVFDAIRMGKARQHLSYRMEEVTADNATEDNLAEKELKKILHAHISSLPEKCREIFVLSRQQQLSTKEIARLLRIAPKTVENQLTIAIRRLRSLLGNNLCWMAVLLSVLN